MSHDELALTHLLSTSDGLASVQGLDHDAKQRHIRMLYGMLGLDEDSEAEMLLRAREHHQIGQAIAELAIAHTHAEMASQRDMSIATRCRASNAVADIDNAIKRLSDLRDQQRSTHPNQAWVLAMIGKLNRA